MDSRYEAIVNDMAEGRGVTSEAIRTMIDSAPHLDEVALAAGYVDAVLNEEGLPGHLGAKHLVPWEQAAKILLKRWRPLTEKYVALLRVAGLIVPGESASPPGNIPVPIPFIGNERAGDLTVVRQVRNLMRNKRAGAVILWVDSGGGSANAAEAMTAALAELAKDRPLVACMNGVAASGGYYICTPARWIVAQPGTITGSIGVLSAKLVTHDGWRKLHTTRREFTRGANATYFSDTAPFTDEQRVRLRGSLERIYRQFLAHVARGRNMSEEAVDAVGGGRVWTGVQAKEHGLVDDLGGLHAALEKARQLANLPDDAPLVIIRERGKPLPPQLAEPAALLRYLQENLNAIASGLPQMLMPFEWQ